MLPRDLLREHSQRNSQSHEFEGTPGKWFWSLSKKPKSSKSKTGKDSKIMKNQLIFNQNRLWKTGLDRLFGIFYKENRLLTKQKNRKGGKNVRTK